MLHILKLDSRYWRHFESGERSFDIQRDNRGFKVGDIIEYWRYDSKNSMYLTFDNKLTVIGSEVDKMTFAMTYLLHGSKSDGRNPNSRFFGTPGVPEGYIVFGIKRLDVFDQKKYEPDIIITAKYSRSTKSGTISLHNVFNGESVSSRFALGDISTIDGLDDGSGSIEITNLRRGVIDAVLKAQSSDTKAAAKPKRGVKRAAKKKAG